MLNFIIDKVNIIIPTLSSVIGFFISIKSNFFGKNKVLTGKYLHFKTIRKEYLEDTTNGYFALQQYFSRRLSVEEMDFILKSPDAYKIFMYIKNASRKYEFIDNKFISSIKRTKYVLPTIGYFISSILITLQIANAKYLIDTLNLYYFIFILVINLCINGPILINCFITIDEITCTLRLDDLTKKKDKKDESTRNGA